MAGSMDRCETCTVTCPGPGSGAGSLVSSQSVARGSPDGRAASLTWWLVGTPLVEDMRRLLKARRDVSGPGVKPLSRRRHGARGCAARVAQAYGEHPETAVRRMRWARTAVTGVFGGARPQPVHPPVPAQRTMPLTCCAA